MFSLLIGIIFILFTVFAALPPEAVGFGLGWGSEMLTVLKGGVPILLAFIGLISIFIGIADIKDRQDAKKEEAAMKLNESKKE